MIYVNGIALGVLKLKRDLVEISDCIRKYITNQQDSFIQLLFSTIQFVMVGNVTHGLKYGTIGTKEKYFLNWQED